MNQNCPQDDESVREVSKRALKKAVSIEFKNLQIFCQKFDIIDERDGLSNYLQLHGILKEQLQQNPELLTTAKQVYYSLKNKKQEQEFMTNSEYDSNKGYLQLQNEGTKKKMAQFFAQNLIGRQIMYPKYIAIIKKYKDTEGKKKHHNLQNSLNKLMAEVRVKIEAIK